MECAVKSKGLSGIYQIKNEVNGKVYIGSAVCIRQRFNEHKSMLERGAHHSRHLQNSWDKHGHLAFSHAVLDLCEKDELLIKEQKKIDEAVPEYNICRVAGNTLGRRHSPETRAKIAEKARGRKCAPRSDEWRENLSKALKGRAKKPHVLAALQAGRAKQVFTEERKQAVSRSLKDAYANGKRRREKTADHCAKIGQFYAKLTDDQVREIRRLRKAGAMVKDLASKFNSNSGTISDICNYKRYKWVTDD